jgi:tight adherence protein C
MTPATSVVAVSLIATGLLLGSAIGPHLTPSRSPGGTAPRRQPPPWRPPHRRAVAGIAALVTALVVHPAIPAIALIVVASLPVAREIRRRRREERAVHAALPDAIELLVLLVHAGLTPHQAVGVMAERGPLPTRHGFSAVVAELHRGASMPDALRSLPVTLGAEASSIADALGLAIRQGLPLGPTLEQLAHDARQRRRRQAEADARTLPVRLSFPLVACTLPSFVLLAIAPAVLAALSSLGDSAR